MLRILVGMTDSIGTRLIRLEPKGDFARIIPLGDVHCGHRAALLEKFRRYIDYIKKTPDTWAIIMGDMAENVLHSTEAKYPGSMFEQIMTPEQQQEWIRETVEPIASKVLFWLGSNHNTRSWFQAGMSPEKDTAKDLGIRWAELDGLANIQIGKNRYVIHATHGSGGASSASAVMRKLEQQAKMFYGADIYLRAHHHQKLMATECIFNAKTGMPRKVYYACTGSFLGYKDTYMHRNGGKPSALGAVKIKLYKNEWDVHITA